MKLVLNSFFLIMFFISPSTLGDVFFKEYAIYTSGIKIGKIDWKVEIVNKNYSNTIKISSEGLLSALYSFEGNYFSEGIINEKILTSNNYTHKWKTNKVNKKMELVFNDNKVESLKQSPAENEKIRLDIYKVNLVKDPLSSFLQIMFGAETSLVIDGRRVYTMNAKYNKNIKQTIVELTDYSNLWADHKRSDFEKITFEKNKEDFFPSKIFIYFDERVFKIKEN